MKKTATLLFILMASVSLLSAQKFALGITKITAISVKGSVDSLIDSVHLGDKVVLNISFQNYGAFPIVSGSYQPDSFPGGLYSFNCNIAAGTNANENKIDFTQALLLPGLAYKAHGTIQDTITIDQMYFAPDTLNIIIIWPTGSSISGGADSLDKKQNGTYQFYLFPHTAGINASIAQNQFSIFPNPAKEVLNISMKESGNGMIRLMDMAGKTIITRPYSSMPGENISLPLNEGAGIPDGLYLVGIQTASGYHVEKVMICR